MSDLGMNIFFDASELILIDHCIEVPAISILRNPLSLACAGENTNKNISTFHSLKAYPEHHEK